MSPSILATKNGNRNMVLAMLQRVPYAHEPFFADGFAAFGLALLIGVNDTIKLLARDMPYEGLPECAFNDNQKL